MQSLAIDRCSVLIPARKEEYANGEVVANSGEGGSPDVKNVN